MNKNRFMPQAGFEHLVGRETFLERGIPAEGWGPSDADFLKLARGELDRLDERGQPWFATLLNVGTHHPYQAVQDADMRVMRQQAFSDMTAALGDFLDGLAADGALGSSSAWMIEPYADSGGYARVNVTDMERIREIARISMENGYQVAVHAIGDRANRETLDLFAAMFDSAGVDGDTLRWRVEHAQHLRPEDIPRFGELGVIASMQAMHACSDAPYVVQRLGRDRAREGAYVWKSLMESGAVVNNGTDVPVEDIDPLDSFHCSVTRAIATMEDSTFYPDQAMTRRQALRSYTINGAYSAFAEDRRGSLEPGKLADITVLSRDITTIPADSIPGARGD
jgi:predicted amidohydrolase YtcJ